MLIAFVLNCALLASSADAEDVSPAWHPYFKSVIAAAREDGRGVVEVDGRPLPHRFSVSVNTRHCALEEADPIEFVIVLPGDVTVDGGVGRE